MHYYDAINLTSFEVLTGDRWHPLATSRTVVNVTYYSTRVWWWVNTYFVRIKNSMTLWWRHENKNGHRYKDLTLIIHWLMIYLKHLNEPQKIRAFWPQICLIKLSYRNRIAPICTLQELRQNTRQGCFVFFVSKHSADMKTKKLKTKKCQFLQQ